jgi:hypothetical protein
LCCAKSGEQSCCVCSQLCCGRGRGKTRPVDGLQRESSGPSKRIASYAHMSPHLCAVSVMVDQWSNTPVVSIHATLNSPAPLPAYPKNARNHNTNTQTPLSLSLSLSTTTQQQAMSRFRRVKETKGGGRGGYKKYEANSMEGESTLHTHFVQLFFAFCLCTRKRTHESSSSSSHGEPSPMYARRRKQPRCRLNWTSSILSLTTHKQHSITTNSKHTVWRGRR